MPKTIEIDQGSEKFISDQIAAGNYSDAGEVVSAALKLLQAHESTRAEKIEHFRRLVEEGISSGNAGPIDMNEILARAIARSSRR